MQWLPVDLLSPGMIVARSVVTDKGVVLVRHGAELTEGLVQRLNTMNVKRVAVEGTPVPLKDYMPKSLDEKINDMEVAFSHVQDDPLMQRFRVLVKHHFIRRAKGEEAANEAMDILSEEGGPELRPPRDGKPTDAG